MFAEIWLQLATQFNAKTGWELIAVSLAITYVVLAARESIWCWPAAFTNTAIFTILFWQSLLPMQALLHLFYLVMAVYGFSVWRRRDRVEDNLLIHFWPWRYHLLFVGIATLITLTLGMLLTEYEASQKPYLDAFVMVFSIFNTFLMARKVLENWLYWLVIDGVAITLYWQTGYLLTAVMSALFLVLALYGFRNWMKLYRSQQNQI